MINFTMQTYKRKYQPRPSSFVTLCAAANWLQLSVASTAGGSRPLAGGAFVSGRGAAPDFATHLMLRHPLALTLVSCSLVWESA